MKYIVLMTFFVISFSAHGQSALIKFRGKSMSEKSLSNKDRQSIYDAKLEHYRKMTQVVEEAALTLYFKEKADKSKKTVGQVREAELKSKNPTDAEVKKFYEQNKARIPYPYEKVKDQIRQWVMQNNQVESRSRLVEKLKEKGVFSVALKEPTAPVFKIDTKGFQNKGNAASKVTVVEFADYQCPHCKHASETVSRLMKTYSKKINLVFVDFPINPSGVSRVVAEGAFCASQQNKYWQYHELAFKEQKGLTKDSPLSMAKKLSLDIKKFSACLKSPIAAQYVEKGKKLGENLGVSGTPSFYINGRRFAGSHDGQALQKAVDQALKAK